MMSFLRGLALPLLSVCLGLALGLSVTLFLGENPFHILSILARSSFGSSYDLGMMLFYSTPLVFTGLSTAIAFRAGLFNIGAEGQLAMGAIACVAAAHHLQGASILLQWFGVVIVTLLAGGLWGAIAGWLRAVRGTHEVISTIMLNFIAAGLTSYLVLYVYKNPDIQGPESVEVGSHLLLPAFEYFEGAPVTVAVIVAALLCVGVHFWFKRSVLGYEIRALGENESAAQFAGIKTKQLQIVAMFLAGAAAAFVGFSEVLGNAGRFKLGFSPGYGFTGIAVALLARANPIGIFFSALLFGALHKGSLDLDFETETVTRDISQIIQAIVILVVSAEGLWAMFGNRRKGKKHG